MGTVVNETNVKLEPLRVLLHYRGNVVNKNVVQSTKVNFQRYRSGDTPLPPPTHTHAPEKV